jgi:hypothetical protein
MPTVTVFIIATDAEKARGSLASLRTQSFDEWNAVVICPPGVELVGEHDSRRVRVSLATGPWQGVLSDEIASARTDHVLILPAGSTLRRGALRSLVAEAMVSHADAVYGRFRFTSGIGELPGDPTSALPSILGTRQWERRKAVPLGAQLFWRESIAGEAFDPSLEDAADWDWCLRLARKGVRWRRCEKTVTDVELRPLASPEDILESVRLHARLGNAVGVTTGGGHDELGDDEPRSMLAQAEERIESLVEFQGTKDAWIRAGMALPWHFSQWWYRQGFVGGAPEHLLAEAPLAAPRDLVQLREKPPIDIFVASYKRPERLAAMIESVRATGYPARVLIAAGDIDTVRACEKFPDFVECVYSTAANRLTGCTAPLNHVVSSLVRNDSIFCTDDSVYAPDSLDIAARSLYTAFPDGDGVVGLAQENIVGGYPLAFPLIGKRYRERFTVGGRQELFFPGYYHMYNDGELGITLSMLGNWHFEPRAKLSHFHPCTGVAEDATHTRGRTFVGRDAQVWHERRMKGLVWGIDG